MHLEERKIARRAAGALCVMAMFLASVAPTAARGDREDPGWDDLAAWLDPVPGVDAEAPEASPATDDAESAKPTIAVEPSPEPEWEVPLRARPATRLEEIVVTAQKRAQSIENVPISISVVDAQQITDWGLTDVREAMLMVPNVQIEEAGFFASPRVRGFSFNNNNKAFEPPAGVAIDGIPYTRVEYFNAALFDVQRIEAMRGPQGTTFGKNTTAGLIHIITRNPTPDYEGYVDVQRGELDRWRAEAAFGGPLGGAAAFRIAALYDDRDGFVRNTTAAVSPVVPARLRSQGRRGARAKLEFPDLAGTTLRLTAETVQLDSGGTGAEMFNASDRIRAVLRRYDPEVDFTLGNYTASIDQPDGRRSRIHTFNVDVTRAIGDWEWVGVAGYSVLDNHVTVDTDFTPAPAIFGQDNDRSPTATAELRLASPDFDGLFGLGELFGASLGSSNLLVGAYFQDRRIKDGGFRFRIGTLPFLELTLAGTQDQAVVETLLDLIPAPVYDLLFGLIPPSPPGGDNLYEEVQQGFEQRARAVAAFTQLEWNFAPRWAWQLGMRYSYEDKSARWNSEYTSPGPSLLLPLAGIMQFEAERQITERQFQPKVSLNFRPRDNVSLFLHRSRAFKGGGFNAFAFRAEDDELAFGPEEASEWGLEAKTTLFGGRARFNVSLYRLDIDDFQVLTRVPEALTIGLGVTKVENAARARAQGAEADLAWLITDWLTVIATAAYNDTEYLDFPNNDCPADMPNPDGCDASGKPFAYAPRENYTLFANVNLPLWGELRFSFGAGAEFQSRQFLDIDLDERKVQESFFRYRANIGISHPRQGWSLRIFGENLSDERTSIRQGDVIPGLFVSLPEPPRQIYAQLRYQF